MSENFVLKNVKTEKYWNEGRGWVSERDATVYNRKDMLEVMLSLDDSVHFVPVQGYAFPLEDLKEGDRIIVRINAGKRLAKVLEVHDDHIIVLIRYDRFWSQPRKLRCHDVECFHS